MACQRLLLVTIAGDFAEMIWRDVCRWSDARDPTSTSEWSPYQWPEPVTQEVDQCIDRLISVAYLPPVLYRAKYVDTWSMGDVFARALHKEQPERSRQLMTVSHELIASWFKSSERVKRPRKPTDETIWLYNRINEGITAWDPFADDRLLLLVRTILGGLWMDEEVQASLAGVPAWWSESG